MHTAQSRLAMPVNDGDEHLVVEHRGVNAMLGYCAQDKLTEAIEIPTALPLPVFAQHPLKRFVQRSGAVPPQGVGLQNYLNLRRSILSPAGPVEMTEQIRRKLQYQLVFSAKRPEALDALLVICELIHDRFG